MQIRNSATSFGVITRILHWVLATLIFALIALGWYMVDLTYFDKWYNGSLTWHKSLGIIVLGLAVLKTGWQFYTPLPAQPTTLRPWERTAARVMHVVLLALMLAVPASGYLISTSAGKGVMVFDWFEVPALISGDTALRDAAIATHFYAAYGIGLLALGHAAAALKHQFLNRDGTLARMLLG